MFGLLDGGWKLPSPNKRLLSNPKPPSSPLRSNGIAMDMCDNRRKREGRPNRVATKNLPQRSEPLIGAEQRLWRREVGGGNTLRPRGDAQINGDRNATSGAIRPADLGIYEAPLIGNRVALLPRHHRTPVFRVWPRAADGGQCSGAPPVRTWGTTRRVGTSSGRSADRASRYGERGRTGTGACRR